MISLTKIKSGDLVKIEYSIFCGILVDDVNPWDEFDELNNTGGILSAGYLTWKNREKFCKVKKDKILLILDASFHPSATKPFRCNFYLDRVYQYRTHANCFPGKIIASLNE